MDERAEQCKTRAEERGQKRKEAIQELLETAQALAEFEQETALELEIKHAQRKDDRQKASQAVMDLIDQKLEELDALDQPLDVEFVDAQEEVTETEKALDQAVNEAKCHQDAAQASTMHMKAQIERLQAQLQEQEVREAGLAAEAAKQQEELETRNKAAADLARRQSESAAAFDMVEPRADPERLPVINCAELVKSHPAGVEACGNMYQLLNRWRRQGAAIPFTFEELMAHSTAAKGAPALIKCLLGKQWAHWFAEDPAPNTTLPRQAVLSLLFTLERAKEQYDQQESAKQEAAALYEKLAEVSKKRRTQ